MPTTLSKQAWEKLIDEDIDYLLGQPRTLERDHIHDCLMWTRMHRDIIRMHPIQEVNHGPIMCADCGGEDPPARFGSWACPKCNTRFHDGEKIT